MYGSVVAAASTGTTICKCCVRREYIGSVDIKKFILLHAAWQSVTNIQRQLFSWANELNRYVPKARDIISIYLS